FFQAEDGIRDRTVTGIQTCALPIYFVTGGHLWATALKKSTPERTKELLRIMNWLAAPFGSEEDQLLTFGVKNVDYTLDERGNPRSEERRVGKECRSRRARDVDKKRW